MTPIQTAAQFAAYVWYTNTRRAPREVVEKEAQRFARKHWRSFMPVAHDGMGRLLLEIAKPRKVSRKRCKSRVGARPVACSA
ncbi:MAG TPA: hypothetical protein VFE62_28830 [Gemmataceae bacterium]|nr:hypothetical protein [Gemmataceae bacterium]